MPHETSDLEEIKPQWRARLEDALSVSTRAKRRLLLVASTISLVIIVLGILPTKIEALGIIFESTKKRDLLILLALVNLYALFGFLLYAWADIHLQARIQRAPRRFVWNPTFTMAGSGGPLVVSCGIQHSQWLVVEGPSSFRVESNIHNGW